MHRARLVSLLLTTALATTPVTAANAVEPTIPSTPSQDLARTTGGLVTVSDVLTSLSDSEDPTRQSLIDQAIAALPVSVGDQRFDAATSRLEPTSARASLDRLVVQTIDPTQHVCTSTPLDAWVRQAIADIDLSTLVLLIFGRALDVSAYDALIQQQTPPNEHYGVDGEWTTAVTHTFRDLRRFWDIDSGAIQLTAAHGDVWKDQDRVRAALAASFGVQVDSVTRLADALMTLVATTPALRGGDHPLFTLNAFAFSAAGESDPTFQGLPDKIIIGDGILDIQPDIGMGTDGVAARAILAHEFGHQVQYAHGLIPAGTVSAEVSRRQELMADALASYFLVHARGRALNATRATEVVTNFANVGDCGFTLPSHHGTPNQRRRAATWGADLASNARLQGHILPSISVIEEFDIALPAIVAPDVP